MNTILFTILIIWTICAIINMIFMSFKIYSYYTNPNVTPPPSGGRPIDDTAFEILLNILVSPYFIIKNVKEIIE